MNIINYKYENEPTRTVREGDIVYYDVSKFVSQPAELCSEEGKTPYWLLYDGRRVSGYAELVTIGGQLHLLDMLMYHYRAFEERDSLIVGDDVHECVLGNLEYFANMREYSCVKDLELDSYRNHECPVEYNVIDCVNIPTIGEFVSTEDRWVRNDAQPMHESTKTQYMVNAARDAELVNRNITNLLRNVAEFSDIKDVVTKQELARLEKIRDLVTKIGARSRVLRDKTERDIYFKVHGNQSLSHSAWRDCTFAPAYCTIELSQRARDKERAAMTNRNLPWSTEEDTFLRNHYPTMSARQVGEKLGRSKYAVQPRARKLKTKSSLLRHWTKEDYDFLRKNYESLGDSGVSEALGRSESDVHHQAQLLNLTYMQPQNWSEIEETLLRRFYRTMNKDSLCALLGRSEVEVEKRARELNLKTVFY